MTLVQAIFYTFWAIRIAFFEFLTKMYFAVSEGWCRPNKGMIYFVDLYGIQLFQQMNLFGHINFLLSRSNGSFIFT